MNAKRFFRRFIEADPERLHFAAHSHHFWPDVTFDAQVESWNDAARFADRKWGHVFETVWPRAQANVAKVLGLPDPGTLAFASNTHELVSRVLSSLTVARPRILTTDGEFHSFARQAQRLEEAGDVTVQRIATEPFETFAERFERTVQSAHFDLVVISQVFFNSGWVNDLERLVGAVKSDDTFVVIDGYHGFMAVPTRLSSLAERAFYVAGGYKYAMSGEGACFLHAPPGYGPRPKNTGWFAAFGALESAERKDAGVEYGPGGNRFLGATFDPTALYRLNAVLEWLSREAIDVDAIHRHVMALQQRFLTLLDQAALPLSSRELVVGSPASRGHFLTFRRSDAAAIHARLLEGNVVTDVRGDRLRVGFGLYHDENDVVRGVERMQSLLG